MSAARRILAILGLALLAPAAGCNTFLVRVEIDCERQVDMTGVKHFCVDTRNGSIEVQCDPARQDADIRVVKFASGSSEEEARPYAEEIEIAAARDPNKADTVRVAARWPQDVIGRNRGAKFTIALPPHARLDLNTSNGNVTVAQAAGGADIDTSNGTITVRDTRGNVSAHTTNGRVILTSVDGDVDARSSNGTIQLDRVGAQNVKVVTSNGRIHAVNVKGNVAARTSNGAIDLRIASVPAAPQISAVSSNGRVLVETPSGVNARLKMRASNGRIHANFDDVGTMREFQSGRSSLSATLNAGNGLIEITSSNGGITFQTTGPAPTGTTGTPVAAAR